MTKSVFTKKYNKFREMLVKNRNESGLTQTTLAKKLGIPQPDVSRNETGVRRVDLVEFLEIAKAIGFDPLEFIKELEES